MCGRYSLTKTPKDELGRVGITDAPEISPRYNIAPGQHITAVVNDPERNERPALRALEWGLIPPWTKDLQSAKRIINARSETMDSKPSFKAAARHRRCLIPADGFYEWKTVGREAKQPYYFHLKDRRIFFLAGLWELWDGPNGEAIDSCTIVTTSPNAAVKPIHSRMPVILEHERAVKWMDPRIQRVSLLAELLQPCPESEMLCFPVSPRVNSAVHDDPSCIDPLP